MVAGKRGQTEKQTTSNAIEKTVRQAGQLATGDTSAEPAFCSRYLLRGGKLTSSGRKFCADQDSKFWCPRACSAVELQQELRSSALSTSSGRRRKKKGGRPRKKKGRDPKKKRVGCHYYFMMRALKCNGCRCPLVDTPLGPAAVPLIGPDPFAGLRMGWKYANKGKMNPRKDKDCELDQSEDKCMYLPKVFEERGSEDGSPNWIGTYFNKDAKKLNVVGQSSSDFALYTKVTRNAQSPACKAGQKMFESILWRVAKSQYDMEQLLMMKTKGCFKNLATCRNVKCSDSTQSSIAKTRLRSDYTKLGETKKEKSAAPSTNKPAPTCASGVTADIGKKKPACCNSWSGFGEARARQVAVKITKALNFFSGVPL